jgi:hypothetical protein
LIDLGLPLFYGRNRFRLSPFTHLFSSDRLILGGQNRQSESWFGCFAVTVFLGLFAVLQAHFVSAFALVGVNLPGATRCFGMPARGAASSIFFGARIDLCCEHHHYTSAHYEHRRTYFCFHARHFSPYAPN